MYTLNFKADGKIGLEFETRGQAQKTFEALKKQDIEATVTVNKVIDFDAPKPAPKPTGKNPAENKKTAPASGK